jgi:hypothetical protein
MTCHLFFNSTITLNGYQPMPVIDDPDHRWTAAQVYDCITR